MPAIAFTRPMIRWLSLLLLATGLAASEAPRSRPATTPKGTPPKSIKRDPPEYPYRMEQAGLTGKVLVEFIVDTSGAVQNPYVVSSNNPWFERPALDAILRWKFSPAVVDGRAVKTRARQQLDFEFKQAGGGSGQLWRATMDQSVGAEAGLWHVGKPRQPEGRPPELQWTKAPVPVNTSFPVYPFGTLQAGQSGKTRLKFLVGPDGLVAGARLLEATTPEMGAAALAMIDTWVFTPPAKKDGTPCYAVLAIDHDFRARGTGDVPVTPEARGILRLLEKSPEKISGMAELDAEPKPRSRRPPVYPTTLLKAGAAGTALIEFFIDRNGDAQLPRVVSSSAPEFGYAAAQAVATWRYEAPLKAGKPATVRVRIPIEFTLPAAG